MNNENTNRLLTGLSVAMIAAGVLSYVKTERTERKKREKIQTWKQENLDCIENSRRRVQAVAEDPTKTAADVWNAIHEEAQFLTIVRNQPMY